ncbi:hypothetical protein C8Q76DRAFT_648002 [Earliella scabrosa]|nr:hypothetical protein C8Q76DRAFT_648002 [Earliella scabrosa]
MDTLLVYAGLFSAVLTAFIVQSYQLLQPSTADATITVLRHISAQINSFTINQSFINSTRVSEFSADVEAHQAPSSAIWINTLWFASLVCSLASASIALIVKQWLQQAIVGLSGTSREFARLRQHRLNSLIKWRVGAIVVALPILLQIALALYLAGMVVLLWTLHATVALVTSSLVGLLFAFFVAVTVLPVFKWDCCYRSPQASAVSAGVRPVYNSIKRGLDKLFRALWHLDIRIFGAWTYDSTRPWSFLTWNWLHYDLEDMPTWHGRDQVAVSHHSGALDRAIATTAYAITLSSVHLKRLHVVLSDLPQNELYSSIQDVHAACERHWGPSTSPIDHYWRMNVQTVELTALYAARHMQTVPQDRRDDRWRRDMKAILEKLVSEEAPGGSGAELFVSTLGPLALGADDLAWRASDSISKFWLSSHAAEYEKASYPVLRSVIAVAEWRLSHWNEEEYKFDNLLVWTRLVYAVLLCLSRTVDNDSISGPQLASICSATRSALSCFERLLVQQDWSRLRPEEEQLEDGRGDVWRGIFPHRLSKLFVIWVIQPLAHILTNTQLRPAIPHSLVHALQAAWLAVRQAYPSPLDLVVLERIPMDTGVRTIVLALDNLYKLLQDTNAPGGGTMTTVRPRITNNPRATHNVISDCSLLIHHFATEPWPSESPLPLR